MFSGLSKDAIRAMPGIKQLLRFKAVHGREIGHFSGRFQSSEQAILSAPAATQSTWDDDDLIENGIPAFTAIYGFDQPVIDNLKQSIAEHRLNVVTDFGGHIGVKHTAYSKVIDFPEHLRWQVVDVPAIIRAAQRFVSPENRALHFFERIEDAAPCEVLLCSGSLQYAGLSPEELVNRMPQKPHTILLNKIPVSSKKGFFTVERFIKSLSYRIYGSDELEENRTRLGYALTARWTIPYRDIIVLHSRGFEYVKMVGEAWTLLPQNATDREDSVERHATRRRTDI